MNRQKALVIVLGMLLLLVAAVWLWFLSGGESVDVETVYRYELNTGEQRIGSVSDVPSPEDEFAWAVVYSCGECTPDEQYIGYLRRFDGGLRGRLHAAARTRAMAEGFVAQHQGPPGDHEVSGPGAQQWIPANSREGQQLIERARRCDNGRQARRCHP